MVVDTSAAMAILVGEPEQQEFAAAISEHPDPVISAATLVEARIVVDSRLGKEGIKRLERLLSSGGIRTVAFDETQAALAHHGWQQFGRGNSPARLNMGDCFSYALARHMDRPLLFKGEDFKVTDIPPATRK